MIIAIFSIFAMKNKTYKYEIVALLMLLTFISFSKAQTVFFDLCDSLHTDGNWNAVTYYSTGVHVPMAIDDSGRLTSVSYECTDGFASFSTAGDISTIYPLNAGRDSFTLTTYNSSARVVIGGLNASQSYDLKFFGSRYASGPREMYITIGGVAKTLETAYNKDQTVDFEGIVCPGSGEIIINFSLAATSSYTYIGVIEISGEFKHHLTNSPALYYGYIDADYLEIFSRHWLWRTSPEDALGFDFDESGMVDIQDFACLSKNWMGYRANERVLELAPAGYWPADEGTGEILHDRSGNNNDGIIYSVPWRDGFLDFDNDVYQWAQIPHNSAYTSETFSMGGWVYYTGGSNNATLFGSVLIGQPLRYHPKDNSKFQWAIWGDRLETDGAMLRFGHLSSDAGDPLIEIISGRQADAIGTAVDNVLLPRGKWQHVLYTFDSSGEGSLYLNGTKTHTAENVPYEVADTPLIIGGGRWGTYNLGGTLSMDGSVRDMVFFDRALSSYEVEKLYESTMPNFSPADEYIEDTENPTLSELIARLLDENYDDDFRAEVAVEISNMGSGALDALADLIYVLESILDSSGAGVPRIDDILRNALIDALIKIEPYDEQVRDLLGRALAKPFFDQIDLSKTYLNAIRPLVEDGLYMDALDLYNHHMQSLPKLPRLAGWGSAHTAEQLDNLRDSLPLSEEYFDAYLSKGFPFSDAYYNAYTQLDIHNGTVYIPVVERLSFEQVQQEYNQTLAEFTDQLPDPDGKWSRLKIMTIDNQGNEYEAFLVGSWFIFDARDEKIDGWSIMIDKDGYIHLTGGQHNQPRQSDYIPGSWEKLGLASDGKINANVMYWVSVQPANIDSFEFVGYYNDPRSIAGWMNYMNFVRSPGGTLFIYGRGRLWSWAMFRYDEQNRQWIEIIGDASDMLQSAKTENPQWSSSLGDTVPYYGPGDGLVSAWQPGGYNFNRAWSGFIRGITFDRTERMHLCMPILGVGEDSRMVDGPVYAYSDDLGETFYRADGQLLKLPLTVNPIPSHNADVNSAVSKRRYDLWVSLVKKFGF